MADWLDKFPDVTGAGDSVTSAPVPPVSTAPASSPASSSQGGGSFLDKYPDVTGEPTAAPAAAPAAKGPSGMSPLYGLARRILSRGAPSMGQIVGEAVRTLVPAAAHSVKSGVTLPHDVVTGEASDTDVPRVLDLAGFGALPKPGSAVRLSPWEMSFSEIRRSMPNFTEWMAARKLRGAATNPEAAAAEAGPWGGGAELVPGSKPTLGQATGDKGILQLERETMLKPENRTDFLQRGEEQAAARTDALKSVAGEGNPRDVANTLRSNLDAIEKNTQAALDDATKRAKEAGEAIGGKGEAEGYGAELRKQTQTILEAEKEHERALWNAVDPNGTLAIKTGPLKDAVDSVYGRMSKADAADVTAEEAKIRDLITSYEGVEPFREATGVRRIINTAMRNERRLNGQSQALRRLQQLRGAVEDALTASAAESAGREPDLVARGAMLPADTTAARIGAEVPKTGEKAYTSGGREVEVRYRVVEGDQLKASHNADFSPNAEYPQELQPRDRSRAAAQAQVTRMARRLQPDRLGASASAGEGAPIVGPDGVVESGNGRVMAIRQAYGEGGHNARAYNEFLKAQGFDVEGMRQPILVRERVTPLSAEERAAFTKEANVSQTMHVSAAERAASDAQKLPDTTLGLYKGGEITSAENRDFVRDFSRQVLDRAEEGSFATKDGKLSIEGERRVQNALTHAAYGDTNLVARLAESGDETIRSFGGALMDAAGEMSQLRRAIDAGHVSPNVDLAPHILHAVDLVTEARARGVPLAQVVAQHDAFAPADAVAELVLKNAYGEDLTGRISRGAFADDLRAYVKDALQQTTEARLFGEPMQSSEILEGMAGARRAARSTGSGANPGAAPRTEGPPVGEPAATPGGARSNPKSATVLERPAEREPNFDVAARQRLSAATEATKQRTDRFGSGPQAEILRSLGNKGDFRVSDAEVGGRIFRPGEAGKAAMDRYRAAVGDGPAMATLQDYIASRLRKAAALPDGTIDPNKLATFLKNYDGALRAFPELRAKFANAGKAAEAIEEAAIARKGALAEYQKGALAKLIGAETESDVVKIVGGIIGREDGAQRMRALLDRVKDNPDALAGLRAAVGDYIYQRMTGNKEIGTSGLRGLKDGTFGDFIRKNAEVLKLVLPESDVKLLQRISDDLLRSKRTLESIRVLPGQSNTTEDLWRQIEGKLGAGHSMLDNLFGIAIIAHDLGGGHAATVGAALGKLGWTLVSRMRRAGMQRVDDLVKEAILNPEVGRTLLMQAKPQNAPRLGAVLDRAFVRSGVRVGIGALNERDRQNRKD